MATLGSMKRHMTLTQLERDDWGPPPYDSFLVTECHRLRHVPMRDFTVENLRILIGQHISLAYTVGMAEGEISCFLTTRSTGPLCRVAPLCFGPPARPVNANVRRLP
jgi:hypothetical protein